ncbi:MAG: ABC transporter substrate-binding protein [Bryobacteraceae bacterium]
MKRRVVILCLFCAAVSAQPVGAQPGRIVSTAPSITEVLYALGLGDRVAGVTSLCTYPPEACAKPKIGGFIDPDLEAIAALKPDLVIVTTNPVRLSKRLQALHLRSLEIDQRNLPAIYESIRLIGDAAGVPDRATKLIASMRGGLDRIRARSMGLPKVRTMFVVGRSPRSLDGLFIAAKSSFLNDLIQIAGGENVFGNAAGSYPPVSLEEVIARNPEVIIDMGDMSNSETITDAHKRELIDLWGRMSSIAAVKEHRVFPIASNIYLVPGPRVVEAAQAIFKMLHPESQK